ncbi:Cyclic pyranopterin monophosphate synthase [bioreactor metagenome]|uniref:Cyclic pyranopterin monophosphate synthase n=1 Tax=bioreactor metagenome TaxID=1076179 RepID=A0A645GX91_9ZZZZ
MLAVAQVAGIMAAKRTGELIPMCHPLPLAGVDIEFRMTEAPAEVHILAVAKTVGVTGVEMEALAAVSMAALAIYDMCKAVDKEMVMGGVRVLEKHGGKSGNISA